MITTSNYILKATVDKVAYLFEYETAADVWEALEEFWHEDYEESLGHRSGRFPIDVYAMNDNGAVITTYRFMFDSAVFHAFFDKGHTVDGRYTLDNFAADIERKDKCYGMTIQMVCDQIAEFTGDSKTEAMRKARIFRKNCCVPLTKVERISLAFGRYSDEHGNYHGENRDTLHFYYRDVDGENYAFTIMD